MIFHLNPIRWKQSTVTLFTGGRLVWEAAAAQYEHREHQLDQIKTGTHHNCPGHKLLTPVFCVYWEESASVMGRHLWWVSDGVTSNRSSPEPSSFSSHDGRLYLLALANSQELPLAILLLITNDSFPEKGLHFSSDHVNWEHLYTLVYVYTYNTKA